MAAQPNVRAISSFGDQPRERQTARHCRAGALDNAVLLPHVASATRETRQAMADLFLDNLATFFATGAVKVSAL